ncbi:GNAT family N-acetyltransferase, partial [Vibrio cholerae]
IGGHMEIHKANLTLAGMLSDYAKECSADGIDKYKDVELFPLEYLINLIEREFIEPDLVNSYLPTITYFCISHNQILGTIRVRRGSTPEIENAVGHIGYETKPTARNQGVATFMLNWVRHNALTSPVIVTCSVNNLASRIVIEKCGGVYLGNGYDAEDGEVRRYKLSCA